MGLNQATGREHGPGADGVCACGGYEVVTAPPCEEHDDPEPHTNANWSSELGAGNEFASAEEAAEGIEILRALSSEFAEGWYRVRRCGGRWPL